GNAAISNFQRVAITGNNLRNLYFQVGSYTTDLTINDNEVDYTPTLATRNLALMYSGAGGGLSRVKIKGNKFTGDVGRCQLKMSSNS
ncbi:hypothetical protein OFN50_34145, partial [Escherichia coli]|nr:hypothetical protein [Escherichia coli]